MTVAEMLDELNSYGFTDTDTAEKVRKINDTIYDIAAREPWPFLETTLTLTFDGISAVPSNFPTDFRAALSLIDPLTGRIMQPERIDTVEKNHGAVLAEVGDPFIYYFVGTQMNLLRIPSSGTTLRLRYVRIPAEVTSGSSEAAVVVPKQFHSVIVMGALLKLYDQEDDPELSIRFEGHFENKLQTMRNELLMRQYDRPERVHVIADDDWFD